MGVATDFMCSGIIGFDGTSNVLAAKKFGIPVKGTHAHAFVSSFSNGDIKEDAKLKDLKDGTEKPFYPGVSEWLTKLASTLGFSEEQTNKGELRAFSAYACAFPSGFLALIDTYNALK